MMTDGSLPTVGPGPVGRLVEALDTILHLGSFTEADLGLPLNGDGILLSVAVPMHEEAVQMRRPFRLRGKLRVPMYEHHLDITGAERVEILDESHTYKHRIDAIYLDGQTDVLTIDATPTYRIQLYGAGRAMVTVERVVEPSQYLTLSTFGPVQTSNGDTSAQII